MNKLFAVVLSLMLVLSTFLTASAEENGLTLYYPSYMQASEGETLMLAEKPERIEKNANPAETGENAAAEPREGAPRRRSRGGRRHRRPQNGENAPAPQNSAE